MPRVVPLMLILPWAVTVGDSVAVAEDAAQVAGRTVEAYAAQIADQDRIVRLRAVRSLGAFGESAGDALRVALDHEDAAVRYIAATQLGKIGGKPLDAAITRLEELAAEKKSLAVRLASSFALCRAGKLEQHLPLLIETLNYPERGIVCSTAELIGDIGPAAAAAIEPLESVHQKNKPGVQGGDYHIGGATMNAIRKIRKQQS